MQDIFAKEFKPKRIIDNPSEEKLREWALEQGGIITGPILYLIAQATSASRRGQNRGNSAGNRAWRTRSGNLENEV